MRAEDEEQVPLTVNATSTADSESEYSDLDNDNVWNEFERRRESVTVPQGELNLKLSKYSLIIKPTIIDEASLNPVQRRAIRNSILDPQVVLNMSPSDQKALARPSARTMQMVLFVVAFLSSGLMPTAEQWALWNPRTNSKEIDFILRMPFVVSYLLGLAISFSITVYRQGLNSATKACFSWYPILLAFPSSLAYVFGDWANLKAQVELDASLWKVMNQSKLLLTALMAWLILGQMQTISQWILLIASSVIILAYAMEGIRDVQINDWPVFFLGCLAIAVTTAAGIVTEFTMKKITAGFMVQAFQIRMASLICTMASLIFELWKNDMWHLFPFKNWTYRTVCLILIDMARGWISMLLLKRLSSLWKALATSLSLVVTYLFSSLFLTGKGTPDFDPRQFIILLGLTLDIVCYASVKRDHQKAVQLKLEADKKLADQR